MKFFRLAYIRKVLAVFTGIFFLNMSFFLAEVSALKLDEFNKQLLENMVRAFSCVSEEERDAAGGEHHDSSAGIKEVDLIHADYQRTLSNEGIILSKQYQYNSDQFHKSPSSETPSQPPEA
jgi:hypothetical protein